MVCRDILFNHLPRSCVYYGNMVRLLDNVSFGDAKRYLETYSLEEILELNELTEADALFFMVEEEFLKLPSVKPVDLNNA